MIKHGKGVVNLVLGVMTCLLLVITATPSQSKQVANGLPASTISVSRVPAETIATQLAAQLREAETVLLAQADATPAPTITTPSSTTITRYVAILSGSNIAPNPASTSAFGSAGAALIGNRLVVRGDYSDLSSPLRDYATDPPNPPNPNVTSGIHIHKGEPSKNGPFQYALTVEPKTQLSGRFRGEYTLTDEQLQALSAGTLYVDLHTKQNRAGELRGIFKAS